MAKQRLHKFAPKDCAPVSVKFNGYDCRVTSTTSTSVTCITSPRNKGMRWESSGGACALDHQSRVIAQVCRKWVVVLAAVGEVDNGRGNTLSGKLQPQIAWKLLPANPARFRVANEVLQRALGAEIRPNSANAAQTLPH